jgi:hypothetical protein
MRGYPALQEFFQPQRREERREKHAIGQQSFSKSSFFFGLCALCAFAVQKAFQWLFCAVPAK